MPQRLPGAAPLRDAPQAYWFHSIQALNTRFSFRLDTSTTTHTHVFQSTHNRPSVSTAANSHYHPTQPGKAGLPSFLWLFRSDIAGTGQTCIPEPLHKNPSQKKKKKKLSQQNHHHLTVSLGAAQADLLGFATTFLRTLDLPLFPGLRGVTMLIFINLCKVLHKVKEPKDSIATMPRVQLQSGFYKSG